MLSSPAQKRPALGSFAPPGTLYDAKRDAFLPISLIQGLSPSSAAMPGQQLNVDVQCVQDGTLRSKLTALGIEKDLGASYIAKITSAGGWDDYLEGRADTGSSEMEKSLILTLSAFQDKANFMDPNIRESLDLAALANTSATHVVTEMHWGAQAAVVASAAAGSNPTSVSETIEKQFAALRSAKDYTPETSPATEPLISYRISYDNTGGGRTEFASSDFSHVVQFVQDFPQMQLKAENGNWHPIRYVLLPLELLSYFLSTPMPTPTFEIDSSLLDQFFDIFDDFKLVRSKVSSYLGRLQSHKFCIPDSHLSAVTLANAKVSEAERSLRSKFAALLVSVRSGQNPSKDLESLLVEFRDGASGPRQADALIGQYDEKIQFVDLVVSRGGLYHEFNAVRPWEYLTDAETYTLFYFSDAVKADRNSWQSHRSLVIDLLDQKRGPCKVTLCDCDQNGPSPRKLRLTSFKNRKVATQDVVDEEGFAADKSLALCDLRNMHRDERPRPQKRRALRVPCPGPNCDSTTKHDWFCGRCRSFIEFGDDDYLYCDCGYSDHTGYAFKCKESISHGSGFESYKPKDLLRLLKQLEPYREMNILILGETGVGKSTFINAFVNYLTFETLDEAIAHDELQWIIPCAFSTQYLDAEGRFHQQDVKIGHSSDENDGSKGESATQNTTVYRIQMGDLIVRLIDTPGIGDTRGIEQDKKNFSNILSTLASFEELHGILILLKPNSARLTLMFKFCVTELLTHLHKDAARNMVFGFTNTRITNYMPGDAFNPLQSLLSKYSHVGMSLSHRNTYCFDSESFRYLAALKQTNRSMDNEEDFRRSWKRSEAEAQRLLGHFQSLQPHGVQSTLSLNRARDLITKLTKPMAEIMDVINRTIRINEDHLREIADENAKGDDLKKKLNFVKLDKKTVQLEKPRTVCTDDKCVEYVDGQDGKTINYKTHCHKQCYLTEIPKDTPGAARLSGCAAFAGNKGACNTCGHKWQSHQHVWYELEIVRTAEIDPDIQARIQNNESLISIKQTAIKAHQAKIQDARDELRRLEEAAAQFGLFLKINSITPYNDMMLAYLDEQIKEERQIVNGTRTSQVRLDGLVATRKEYEQQIRILEREAEAGRGAKKPLDEHGVEKLVADLYNMRGWGASLKDIKMATEYYGASTYNERHFRAHRRWHVEGSAAAGPSSGSSSSNYSAYHPRRTYGLGSSSLMGASSSSSSSTSPRDGYYETVARGYSSLIPSDGSFLSGFGLGSSSSPHPRSSVVMGKPLAGDGITEVEPLSLSSKLRSGIMGKLRKSGR